MGTFLSCRLQGSSAEELNVQEDPALVLLNRGTTQQLFRNPYIEARLAQMGLREDTAFGCAMEFQFRHVRTISMLSSHAPSNFYMQRAVECKGLHVQDRTDGACCTTLSKGPAPCRPLPEVERLVARELSVLSQSSSHAPAPPPPCPKGSPAPARA